MRKSKFTDSQITEAMKRVEAGFGVRDISREMEASIFILFSFFWKVTKGEDYQNSCHNITGQA